MVPLIKRRGLLENWIPIWPQLDEDFEDVKHRSEGWKTDYA